MYDFTIDISKCIAVLERGGVIVFPTDTIWGLGCDATNAEAVAKVLQIKERSSSQGLIVLLDDKRALSKYVAEVDVRIFDYLETTTKPTTVIYEGGKGVAENILPINGTLAIRLVKDDFCQALIAAFGKPIVSTSANLHGSPSPGIFKEIEKVVLDRVDYIVSNGPEADMVKEASAVVKWLGNGKVEVIRP